MKKANLWSIIILALVAGIGSTAWLYKHAERQMRRDFLRQAGLMLRALDMDLVQQLRGEALDLERPAYKRLRAQMAGIMKEGGYHCVYLTGSRPSAEESGEREVFFFVDVQSDFVTMIPAATPGTVYEDASPEWRAMFDGGPALVEGPSADDWGQWISALVPVLDADGRVIAVAGVDIDAVEWRWSVVARIALPVGFILFVLILAVATYFSLRRVAASPSPVLRRLFTPLAVVLILLVVGGGMMMAWLHRIQVAAATAYIHAELLADLRVALDQRTRSMEELTASLASGPDIRKALHGDGLPALTGTWLELQGAYHRNQRISRMKLLSPDRTCLLRTDDPAVSGDRLPAWFEADAAFLAGAPFSGLVVDDFGFLIVRSTRAVIEDGVLHGFVELCSDVRDIVAELHERHHRDLVVLLRKSLVNRAAWEQSMVAAGMSMEWNRFPGRVISYASRDILPVEFAAYLSRLDDALKHDHSYDGQEVHADGRIWRLSVSPLHDATGQEIGDLLVVTDMSKVAADFRNTFMIGGVLAGLLLTGLLALTFVLLRRTDAGIRAQQAQLIKLTGAVEQSPATVVITDLEGNIEYVNQAFIKTTGYTREEVTGRNPRVLKSGQISDDVYKMMWATIKAGSTWQGEFHNMRKDGTFFWESATLSPVRDPSGVITNYLAVKEDITERKARDERLSAFAECLLGFGSDPQSNINKLVALCGKLLGGACALYSRMEGEMLFSVGKWQTPPDFNPIDRAQGHICHDVIHRGVDEPVVIRHLQQSSYYESDPNVAPYALQTYIGMVVRSRGIAVGSLAVVYQHDVDPTADQLNFLRLAGFAASVEENRLNQIKMHALLTDIATTYINLPLDRVDQAIEHSLGELGKFVEADRAYLFDYNFKESSCTNTHEWCGAGIEPQINDLQAVPLEMVTWWVETHKCGKTMYVSDVLALPPESGLRRILEPQGIRSLIAVPMMDGKECAGFAGFDSVRHAHEYSESERHLLSVFAQMLISVRKRRRMEEDLRDNRIRAEAANQAKSEFLANLSHEIRTPMNGIIGMINLLMNTPINAEQQRFADTAMSSAESLLALLNDVLDFSKMEAGRLVLDSADFNLRRIMDEAVAPLALRAQEKGVEFICAADADVPVFLRGDPVRLRQVLVNLAGNAVKFTEKGEVVLRASLEKNGVGDAAGSDGADVPVTLRFTVKDTGIGIPKHKKGILFEKFSQVDASTTRQYGGTGLGLAIAKELVEMMGGEIGVESELGEGAVFWFTATLRPGISMLDEAEEVPAPSAAGSMQGARVLVVDDNETNREILRAQLQSWGLVVQEAANGPEAMKTLRMARERGEMFNLAVLDMQMPGMDGMALAQVIRAEPAYAAMRMILLTSIGHIDKSGALLAAGFSAWLSKPVRASELFNAVQQTLHGKAVRVEPSPQEEPAKQNSPWAGYKVLLVEDNPVNRMVAQQYLRKMGVMVETAEDGNEALAALRRGPVDLVLMDVQMPVMDGNEATRRIRAGEVSEHLKDIPIIAMTAHAMSGDREKCIEAGMSDYLAKPVRPSDLQALVGRWLSATAPKSPG